MSDDSPLLDYHLFKRLYPIRKFAFIASILFLVLSLLVVVECAFVLTETIKFNNPILVTFSYFLATFLVVLGLVGLRYSYMSSSMVNNCNQPIVVETPGTSPIWISTNMTQFGEQELLPGTVNITPPPRYSSLGNVIGSAGSQRRSSSETTEAKP